MACSDFAKNKSKRTKYSFQSDPFWAQKRETNAKRLNHKLISLHVNSFLLPFLSSVIYYQWLHKRTVISLKEQDTFWLCF